MLQTSNLGLMNGKQKKGSIKKIDPLYING